MSPDSHHSLMSGTTVADPEGVHSKPLFETKLFLFHGDFFRKSGKINK